MTTSRIRTETHERAGSLGLLVEHKGTHVVRWCLYSDYLAGQAAWTTADLGAVARMLTARDENYRGLMGSAARPLRGEADDLP